jgi:hypothetical protein
LRFSKQSSVGSDLQGNQNYLKKNVKITSTAPPQGGKLKNRYFFEERKVAFGVHKFVATVTIHSVKVVVIEENTHPTHSYSILL